MNTELLIPLLTFGVTLLLVVTGLLNFSVFVRQLRAAREQLETARRQLESARQQPEIQLVQRAMAIWSAPTERSGGGAFLILVHAIQSGVALRLPPHSKEHAATCALTFMTTRPGWNVMWRASMRRRQWRS